MNPEEFAEYWEAALNDPDRIWPEDVLTEDEWRAGWVDRQIIAGVLTERDRSDWPAWLGGTATEEHAIQHAQDILLRRKR